MKPEQRPNVDDTREPENASPRRVPLNDVLGVKCMNTMLVPTRPRKKPCQCLVLDATHTKTRQGEKAKKSVQRLPRNDSSRSSVRPARDRCACQRAALLGRKWTERVMRRVTPALKSNRSFQIA